MGYSLQGLIARHDILAPHAKDYSSARIIPLAHGFALIPLTDDLFDAIGDGSGGDTRFFKLSPGVTAWARRISTTGPVTYVEAEFFGGTGMQKSVVWIGGERVLGPVETQDAINVALHRLGARPETGDEFNTLGLGRHRHTEEWAEDLG